MAYTSVLWSGDGITYSIPGAGDTAYSVGNTVSALLISLATNAVSRTGTQTLTGKTLTAPIISTISNTGTLTLPTTTDTLVGRATTDTLTNKTLTAPIIATISNTGTITLPTATCTLVGKDTTDILTNKTIAFSSNTFSGTLGPANGGTGVANNAANTTTFSGNFGLTLTLTNTTALTLPTSGTLVAAFAASQVITDSPNGHGAVNTRIRRWTNSTTTGSDITYADSANNGGTFTIATAGRYMISYSDAYSVAAANIGISLNSANLTTNVESLTAAERLMMTTTASANNFGAVAIAATLAVNDVIRAHTNGNPNTTATTGQFRIVRIG